jgi:hypothetical protein
MRIIIKTKDIEEKIKKYLHISKNNINMLCFLYLFKCNQI